MKRKTVTTNSLDVDAALATLEESVLVAELRRELMRAATPEVMRSAFPRELHDRLQQRMLQPAHRGYRRLLLPIGLRRLALVAAALAVLSVGATLDWPHALQPAAPVSAAAILRKAVAADVLVPPGKVRHVVRSFTTTASGEFTQE